MNRLWLATPSLIVATVLSAAPALGDSITTVPGNPVANRSLVTLSCEECPPMKDPDKVGSYVVQELEPGTQKVEIREIDGKTKLVRTEAWLGGSPIVFINTIPGDKIDEADAASTQPMPPVQDNADATPALTVPQIDAGTTSALNASVTGEPATPADAVPAFDPDSLELRPTR